MGHAAAQASARARDRILGVVGTMVQLSGREVVPDDAARYLQLQGEELQEAAGLAHVKVNARDLVERLLGMTISLYDPSVFVRERSAPW